MIDSIADAFTTLQAALFEVIVQPLLFSAGFGAYAEQAYEGCEWFLIGLVELALLYVLLRPLEAWFPAQRNLDPAARRIDFLYSCIHRLGLFTVMVFFVLDPLFAMLESALRIAGVSPFNLENLWPGVTDIALVSFLMYLVVLDFFDYWYHRGSHSFGWWWGLHSLHHSQRDMNLWSDNRNHLLDDMLRGSAMAFIALAIGVEPAQFVLLVVVTRMLQSLQHANVRLRFGAIGERLLVSPRYHRLHHAIGMGHESNDRRLGGHNFAVLFPVWDILFGTANLGNTFEPTGIRDQLAPPAGTGRRYGDGFWEQQWLGLQRMIDHTNRRPF